MNGHFSRFTTDKLLDFPRKLERKVMIRISPHKPGEPYQEVAFGRGGPPGSRMDSLLDIRDRRFL
jgi:hypothetical protein